MALDGDLVGHGARGAEEGGLLAEHGSGHLKGRGIGSLFGWIHNLDLETSHLLQAIDSGVVSPHIIPDRGSHHGLKHLRRRPCHLHELSMNELGSLPISYIPIYFHVHMLGTGCCRAFNPSVTHCVTPQVDKGHGTWAERVLLLAVQIGVE